jgi:hypothetical protein
MSILIAGFCRRPSLQKFQWTNVIGGEPSIATHNLKRHRSISMVEEPTKTLRGALAFFRGASCSIKTRDPIKQDRMIYFATARRIVNAAKKIRDFRLSAEDLSE